jgi:hypothetical protein
MTHAWKFSIDFAASPEFTETEVRQMVAETANEADGRVLMIGDDVYMTKFDDAFSFRMRAGHLVAAMSKSSVEG